NVMSSIWTIAMLRGGACLPRSEKRASTVCSSAPRRRCPNHAAVATPATAMPMLTKRTARRRRLRARILGLRQVAVPRLDDDGLEKDEVEDRDGSLLDEGEGPSAAIVGQPVRPA